MWEAPVPRFFFDYFDGKHVHTALDPLDMPDLDTAYLEAFKAATDIWGEALRQRRNPSSHCFLIRDRNGAVIMEVPFAEILESSRGARPERPSKRSSQRALPGTTEYGWRHVRKGRRIIEEQRKRVERLRMLGCDTASAEQLLDLFGQSLALLEKILKLKYEGARSRVLM